MPGIMVALSFDEGESWELVFEVPVWDTHERERLGVDRNPGDKSMHSENPIWFALATAR